MTFEHELRRRLHDNAADLQLHGGGVDAVVVRARQRRHRRNAAMGTVGTVALLAGTLAVVTTRDQDQSGLAVGTPVLPTAGPIELAWSSEEGGVIGAMSSAVAPDGTIYALSTEPGSTYATSDFRSDTLYRLDAEGRWSPRSSDQTGVALADLAAGSDLLYGVSTAPMAEGAGYGVELSSSADGGDSWDTTRLPAVERPSDAVPWRAHTGMKVAASGTTAVAVVTTSFWLSQEDVPGAEQVPAEERVVSMGADGIVVGRFDRSVPTPTTIGPDGASSADGIPAVTVSWNELGVTGLDDLSRTDVYVDRGEGWVPVDASLDDIDVVDGLAAADGSFVLTGQGVGTGGANSMSRPFTYVSDDGTSWRPVTSPVAYRPVQALGSSFVVADDDGKALQVSTDQGGTWQSVPVPGQELTGGGFRVGSITAGPLGLVATITDEDGGRVQGVMVTRDLQTWTTYDLDGLGAQSQGYPQVLVGTDRILVTITFPGADQANEPSRSRTFVGVPVRTEPSPTTTTVVVEGTLDAPVAGATVPTSVPTAPAGPTATSMSTTTTVEPSATGGPTTTAASGSASPTTTAG